MVLNTAPYEWTIDSLMDHIKNGPFYSSDGTSMKPVRPYGMYSLRSRFSLAWMVFTGKADALRWPGQMPKAY